MSITITNKRHRGFTGFTDAKLASAAEISTVWLC
ncbi:hypothetical protein T4C_3487 [Trichinella pseudospiralis]|uniref:Uncharacterized protein n=1 Tax=Trichinella pseudospiralis TaxID=6337 RepID=A0A0V1GI16_TRIPS|nr:hypothetical protein T4C_3487 [Trichinella pseudospiralis]